MVMFTALPMYVIHRVSYQNFMTTFSVIYWRSLHLATNSDQNPIGVRAQSEQSNVVGLLGILSDSEQSESIGHFY